MSIIFDATQKAMWYIIQKQEKEKEILRQKLIEDLTYYLEDDVSEYEIKRIINKRFEAKK